MSGQSWSFDPGSSADELARHVVSESGVEQFDLAIVLGSGWSLEGLFSESLGEFRYADWPCFPAGQISGHQGRLTAAQFGASRLLVFSGRFHCYQGLSAFDASFPMRLASVLGCSRVLLTCATGGIRPGMATGDLVLVDDHLNLLGDNPLSGLQGETFVDLTGLYCTDHYEALQETAANLPFAVHKGVLAAMPGPSYETPAEIRMLSTLGADVVSMSTVPEAIMACYLGMDVVALAMVANPAAGLCEGVITHEDVLESASGNHPAVSRLLESLLTAWLKNA